MQIKLEEGVRHVGTKYLKAWPMTREQYNEYRGWTMPEVERGDNPGYLVEYERGGEPNHANHAGYISWSPKDVFEEHYVPCGDEGL